jgi:cytochrome P450
MEAEYSCPARCRLKERLKWFVLTVAPIAPYPAQELLSRDFARCPYPQLHALQNDAPIHQVENLPWYLVSRFEDCVEVLRDSTRFSSEFREFGAPMAEVGLTPRPEVYAHMLASGSDRGSMFDVILHRDPPAHTRQRRLVNKALTARISRWEGFIENQVTVLMRQFDGIGEMDAFVDFAVPLPIAVIADILGVSADHTGKIKQWSNDSAAAVGRRASDEDWLRMSTAIAQQRRFFAGEVRKRLENPSDDLVGLLAAATQKPVDPETGDEPLTFEEAVEMLVLLLVAGNETTIQLLGAIVYYLATEPGLLERIRADEALISDVVEEALRLTAPIQTMMRFVVEDAEIGGISVPKGSLVSVCFNQANRDPRLFQEPDRFDVDRSNIRRHLAFSTGIHLCPGAPLARLEARTALRQMVRKLRRIELTGNDAARYDMASLSVRGMTSLRVRYECLPG